MQALKDLQATAGRLLYWYDYVNERLEVNLQDRDQRMDEFEAGTAKGSLTFRLIAQPQRKYIRFEFIYGGAFWNISFHYDLDGRLSWANHVDRRPHGNPLLEEVRRRMRDIIDKGNWRVSQLVDVMIAAFNNYEPEEP